MEFVECLNLSHLKFVVVLLISISFRMGEPGVWKASNLEVSTD